MTLFVLAKATRACGCRKAPWIRWSQMCPELRLCSPLGTTTLTRRSSSISTLMPCVHVYGRAEQERGSSVWCLFLQSAQKARGSLFKEHCARKISFFFARTWGAALRLSAFTREASHPTNLVSYVILLSNHTTPVKERNQLPKHLPERAKLGFKYLWI